MNIKKWKWEDVNILVVTFYMAFFFYFGLGFLFGMEFFKLIIGSITVAFFTTIITWRIVDENKLR